MIGWLSGHVIEKQPGAVILNVNGVGYAITTTLTTFFQIEDRLRHNPNIVINLYIYTLVREDALLLYGFLDLQEKTFFLTLIKINGIGPKMAVGILSNITVTEFNQALVRQDLAKLSKLPGIGKKTAERLLVELKETVCMQPSGENNFTLPQNRVAYYEAINALESLGYKPQEAIKRVQAVDDGKFNCEELIKRSLKL